MSCTYMQNTFTVQFHNIKSRNIFGLQTEKLVWNSCKVLQLLPFYTPCVRTPPGILSQVTRNVSSFQKFALKKKFL